ASARRRRSRRHCLTNAGAPRGTDESDQGLCVRSLARARAGIVAGIRAIFEHFVDEAESLGLVGLEELVTVHRLLDLLDRLAGVLGVKLVEALAHAQDLARLDLDVRGHDLGAARGLVDHDPAVAQGDAHPGLAGGQKEAAHRRGLADDTVPTLGRMYCMVSWIARP